MHAVIAEELAHHAAGIRGDVLERRRLRGSRGHDDRVIERAVILQRLDYLGDGRALLADSDIDTIELARFVCACVDLLLIEDGIDNERSLAGLAVADDQLALATPDRHQRVDRLEPGLYRFVHRPPRDDAWRFDLNARAGDIGQRALAVDRLAQRIDDAPQETAPDGHIDDRASALDDVTFVDAAVLAEDDDPDVVALEVERHAPHPVRELDHLARLHLVEPVDTRNAIADRQDRADFRDIGLGTPIGDLVLEDRRNLGRADFHENPFRQHSS